jgi:hypothetical protein
MADSAGYVPVLLRRDFNRNNVEKFIGSDFLCNFYSSYHAATRLRKKLTHPYCYPRTALRSLSISKNTEVLSLSCSSDACAGSI